MGTGKPTKVSFLIDEIKKIIPGIKINIKGNTPGDQNFVCADSKKLKQKLKIKTFTIDQIYHCKECCWFQKCWKANQAPCQ
mgnify:CR=1 FL=1